MAKSHEHTVEAARIEEIEQQLAWLTREAAEHAQLTRQDAEARHERLLENRAAGLRQVYAAYQPLHPQPVRKTSPLRWLALACIAAVGIRGGAVGRDPPGSGGRGARPAGRHRSGTPVAARRSL